MLGLAGELGGGGDEIERFAQPVDLQEEIHVRGGVGCEDAEPADVAAQFQNLPLVVAGSTLGMMLVNGPAEKNECWYCYGAEVRAVADGVISMTQDGIVENVALGKPVIEITWQTAAGNLIIQDIGDGRFAFYAHLIPGSLTVKEGEHVRAGQVIARLGNSGNSDAPHLHFHIGTRNSPLGAQGLPYQFAAYRRTGYAGSTDEIMQRLTDGKPWEDAQAPVLREDDMFASNDVVILE